MAVRTALLTSRNINLDTDFSKYIETVSEPGVITGLAVTASAVGTGQAWVPCERTNGETIYAFVQNFNSVAISGNGYVIISIPQNIVDNGGGNEDGTGIATIEVVNELPAKNYLQLATISSGTVTDTRNMIPTVGELKTDVNSLFASVEDLDTRVDALEAAGAIDHLEERALVGENYALTNTLFKQITPKLADSTVEANVGDVAANTEIHIQRLGSGTASDELKLKMKMAGSPTTSVKVEVREGTKVNVSSSEAYWYGNSSKILATGTLTSSSFSNDWQEVTFALDNEVGGTEGQLLDIVVYQTTGSGATVNSTNYYVLACDSTQRSEGFSYVSVNGSTRSRSKLMPYCISDGFAQFMLSKVEGNTDVVKYSFTGDKNFSNSLTEIINYTPTKTTIKVKGQLKTNCNARFDFVSGAYTLKSITSTTNTLVNINETFDNITISNGFAIKAIWTSGGTASNAKVTFTPIQILEDLGITIPKDFKRGKPRELKAIGCKASITLFGEHIDNERIGEEKNLEDYTFSGWVDKCKKYGTEHLTDTWTNNTYTFRGYGIALVGMAKYSNSGASGYATINGYYFLYCYSNNYICNSSYVFCKPGDVIERSGSDGIGGKFYDFY